MTRNLRSANHLTCSHSRGLRSSRSREAAPRRCVLWKLPLAGQALWPAALRGVVGVGQGRGQAPLGSARLSVAGSWPMSCSFHSLPSRSWILRKSSVRGVRPPPFAFGAWSPKKQPRRGQSFADIFDPLLGGALVEPSQFAFSTYSSYTSPSHSVAASWRRAERVHRH